MHDRRKFIAASAGAAATTLTCSLPAIATAPPDTTSCGEWERKRAAYLAASRTTDDFRHNELDPAYERYKAWQGSWPSYRNVAQWPAEMRTEHGRLMEWYAPIEQRYNDLVDARTDGLNKMLMHPAPDSKAVVLKLEAVIADEHWECTNIAEVMDQILADACAMEGHDG